MSSRNSVDPYWAKYFFNCKLDNNGVPVMVVSEFFQQEELGKTNILDRILQVDPGFNYNQMYFEFKKMRASGIIKEFPKKKIVINKQLLEYLRGKVNDPKE